MRLRRSILISSIVAFVSRIHGVSGQTTLASSRLGGSSKPSNSSSLETSGENEAPLRARFSNGTSLSAGRKGPEASGRNATGSFEPRGLFEDKGSSKSNANGDRLINSVSALLSDSAPARRSIENGARKQPGRAAEKNDLDGKGLSSGAGNRSPLNDTGLHRALGIMLDPRSVAGDKKVPTFRSMFEIDEDNNSELSGLEEKVKLMMAKLRSSSKERRESLAPYFERFLSGVLEKFEARDDEETEELEDLLDRCTAQRCCSGCCSCEKRKRKKPKAGAQAAAGNTRRKAQRYSDDASGDGAKKKVASPSSSSAAPSTTTAAPTKSALAKETSESHKKMKSESLQKPKNRRRKRPEASRRKMQENNGGRKKTCVRRKSAGERRRRPEVERGSRSSRRNFDRDTKDSEIIVRKKPRPNRRTSFDDDSSDSETIVRKKPRANRRRNFHQDTDDSEKISQKKSRPKHRANFDEDTSDSENVPPENSRPNHRGNFDLDDPPVDIPRRNSNRSPPKSLEETDSYL
ncbi:RNA polymerase-associated protein CTR9 homolog [Venturia canescens]|uniref:RNA polymerase-associated protein CTR9 homolog n=1 Tax=Venturia canescens TaxID=32260 RepID=UPI001C9C4B9A|nr:RNA polymerase-associated protein CTR9 homolog [Venturia canescens]XP_043280930.1 RNA polymerase-associated protein CTR9 homolog [Venturia canescens]